jgi:hypothetical protein
VAVEAANRRFYAALENSDFEQMCALWLHADWVKCVHPGWEVLRGWEQVRESWEQIFTNSRGLRAAPTEIEIRIEGDFAWVSCTENHRGLPRWHACPRDGPHDGHESILPRGRGVVDGASPRLARACGLARDGERVDSVTHRINPDNS